MGNNPAKRMQEAKLQAKEWQWQLKTEVKGLDREIKKIQAEETKMRKEIEACAAQGNVQSVQLLARQLVRSRKAVRRLERTKVSMHAVNLQLTTSIATMSTTSALRISADAMKNMNKIANVAEVGNTIGTMRQEMAKFAEAEDGIEAMMLDSDEENDAAVEVQKVLEEMALDQMGPLAQLPVAAPSAAQPPTAQVAVPPSRAAPQLVPVGATAPVAPAHAASSRSPAPAPAPAPSAVSGAIADSTCNECGGRGGTGEIDGKDGHWYCHPCWDKYSGLEVKSIGRESQEAPGFAPLAAPPPLEAPAKPFQPEVMGADPHGAPLVSSEDEELMRRLAVLSQGGAKDEAQPTTSASPHNGAAPSAGAAPSSTPISLPGVAPSTGSSRLDKAVPPGPSADDELMRRLEGLSGDSGTPAPSASAVSGADSIKDDDAELMRRLASLKK